MLKKLRDESLKELVGAYSRLSPDQQIQFVQRFMALALDVLEADPELRAQCEEFLEQIKKAA